MFSGFKSPQSGCKIQNAKKGMRNNLLAVSGRRKGEDHSQASAALYLSGLPWRPAHRYICQGPSPTRSPWNSRAVETAMKHKDNFPSLSRTLFWIPLTCLLLWGLPSLYTRQPQTPHSSLMKGRVFLEIKNLSAFYRVDSCRLWCELPFKKLLDRWTEKPAWVLS